MSQIDENCDIDSTEQQEETLITTRSLERAVITSEESDHAFGIDGSRITSFFHEEISIWKMIVLCMILVICTSGLVICLPPYLEAVNKTGDTYSALLFVSIFTCLPIFLYVQFRHNYFCQISRLGPSSVLSVATLGSYHGLAWLIMTYSLDRKRVPCHIQEPMMGAVLIYMVVIYFVYKGPELNSHKMLNLCGVLAGLFLGMDFQLNDIYVCRGKHRVSHIDDDGGWGSQVNAIWTLAFAAALLLYTNSWMYFEKIIICRKAESTSLRIVNTVSGAGSSRASDTEALLDIAYDGVGNNGGPAVSNGKCWLPPATIRTKFLFHLVWFLFGSLVVIICLFWTDTFSLIGKGDSFSQFVNYTSNGFSCHFSSSPNCTPTALYGWMFVLFNLGFLFSIGCVLSHSFSIIYCLAIASLALPISTIWWTVFRMGGKWGMEGNPTVNGELIFGLLGIPVMLVCLSFWTKLNRMKPSNNSYSMISTC